MCRSVKRLFVPYEDLYWLTVTERVWSGAVWARDSAFSVSLAVVSGSGMRSSDRCALWLPAVRITARRTSSILFREYLPYSSDSVCSCFCIGVSDPKSNRRQEQSSETPAATHDNREARYCASIRRVLTRVILLARTDSSPFSSAGEHTVTTPRSRSSTSPRPLRTVTVANETSRQSRRPTQWREQ